MNQNVISGALIMGGQNSEVVKRISYVSCLKKLPSIPCQLSHIFRNMQAKLKEGDKKTTKAVNQTHTSIGSLRRNLRITEDQFQDTVKCSYIIPKPWSSCTPTLQFTSLSKTPNTPVDSLSMNYLWFELTCLKQTQSPFLCNPHQISQNCSI